LVDSISQQDQQYSSMMALQHGYMKAWGPKKNQHMAKRQ
jgi:hypothetical protein